MRMELLALVLVALMALPMAHAFTPTKNYCINETTLEKNITQVTNTNGVLSNVTITEDKYCQFGCDNLTASCLGETTNNGFGISLILAMVGVSALFITLSFITKQNHAFISFIFFFMTQIGIYFTVGLAAEVAKDAGKISMANAITGLLLPVGVFFFITLTYFIINLYSAVMKRLVEKKEAKILGM